MTRFYVRPQDIEPRIVNFNEAQSRKIRKVLRLKVGDPVEVFDGNGNLYVCEFLKITSDFSIARIVERNIASQNALQLVLVQALPKNLKVEFVLQKCTELGVDKILFWESEFSQIHAPGISKEKVKRWKRIAAEASEQCKRLFVPEIDLSLESLDKLLGSLEGKKVFLEKDAAYLAAGDLQGQEVLYIFVGPEGGFSPKEKSIFAAHKVQSIKIAENVLRSETAGMTFLAQAQLFRV